ncbi:Uncharacterized conserved protein, DUF1499 family [Franzmannia pantelleriensis]|uniref:Uncharacterized conserved protein, DUF1499 family n=1 Tax=Franzmannia pantelleriensis TaxID=48727 RepID=A0A1G9I5L2_9GAMM|nr:DUF1499 domain-containing protein [Halomonas pantelleriensis]SDL20366.1 Uncharacterized conserved protein, DUF1499 family [Halomonas pantelleriensis]
MSKLTLRPRPRGGRWPVVLAWLSLLLLGGAALLMGGAGPAHRLDLIDLGTAFGWLRQGAYVALAAAAMGLMTLLVASLCKRVQPALVGGLVIVAVASMMWVPYQLQQRAQQVPPIHDITTDLDDPPAFVTLAEAREAAPNAVDHPGERTARQQREAYPDIQPIMLELSLDDALSAAEAAALDQGWALAEVSRDRIEATATTRWFGFKDDVAIRLSEVEGGTQVDVRSASRLGRSDMGTNAQRIRDYLAALRARVE